MIPLEVFQAQLTGRIQAGPETAGWIIHRSATTLKSLASDVSDIDLLVAMHSLAEKF